MKIHEYQAKEFFKKAGIPVPEERLALDLPQALENAETIGFPLVLKSQVLVGGRGKAGGIKAVKDNSELEKNFAELKKLTIKGYRVEKILMCQAIEFKKEFYLAVTIDSAKNDIVLIASSEGGVDIEETAQRSPEKIQKLYLQGKKSVDSATLNEFIKNVFGPFVTDTQPKSIIEALIGLFFQNDCSLAEINPLVVDSQDRWCGVDAKMIFDDNAFFRHPEFPALRDMAFEDADEIEAKQKDLSFVKLDGNIGCIVNGAGLAMATTDVIKMAGGDPANFLDVGGSSNPEKVLNALKIILHNSKIKAILINIFGGITRCDDIAKGILEAKKQIEIKVPLVIRLTGTNEKEAIAMLTAEKMNIYSSMRQAVEAVVKLAK